MVKELSSIFYEKELRNKKFPAEELLDDMSIMFSMDKNSLKRNVSNILINLISDREVKVSSHKLHVVVLWLDELERIIIKNKKGLGLFSVKKNRARELNLIRKYKKEFEELIRVDY